jgi:chaperonin cofactor prefoldin
MNNSISLTNGLQFNKNKQSLQEGMRDMNKMNTNETIIQDAYEMMNAYSKGRTSEEDMKKKYAIREKQIQQLLEKFDNIKDKLINKLENYIDRDSQNYNSYNCGSVDNKVYINADSTQYKSEKANETECEKMCSNDKNCEMYLMSDDNTCHLYKNVSNISTSCYPDNNHNYWGKVKMNLSTGTEGNLINKSGVNIFVTEPGVVDENNVNFEGCYTDTPKRAIPELQEEGYVFNVDSCAQRAIDKGKTIFGVQNVKSNGVAKCFIGDNLGDAKKYGNAYKKEKLWESGTKNKGVELLLLNFNGKITLNSVPFLTEDQKKDVYVGHSYSDNVKKVDLERIGMDVGNIPMNTQNPSWKNTFSVENNGKSISVRRTDQTTGWGQNLHLEGKYKDVDNIVWSSDNNSTNNYNCPSYFVNNDNFTSKEAKYCSGYRLVMQNDGNLVVVDENNNIVWSTNTNKPGEVKVDEWLDETYRGRDFINAGETLSTGQWITSKNGANIAILEDDGNLVVYKSLYPCKTVNGKVYGSSYSNAVYSLPKSNTANLGSMMYLDNEANKTYSYPNFISSNYDLQDDKFILIGPYNSYIPDISSFSASSVEQCEEAASKIPDCGGFVYNKTQQRCFLKGKQIWPKSQRLLDNDCIMKIKAPKVNVNNSCPTDFLSVNSSNFELYPKPATEMTPNATCGLRRIINENKGDYDKENKILIDELDNIVKQINILSQQQDENNSTIPELRNRIKSRFSEYNQLRNEYKKYHNKTLDPTLSQYKKDSEMNRNMYKTDASLMALLGVGGLLLAMNFMK